MHNLVHYLNSFSKHPIAWLNTAYGMDELKYGIAYGVDDIPHAINTTQYVRSNLEEQQRFQIYRIKVFKEQAMQFFEKKKKH